MCKREITREEALVYLQNRRTDLLTDFTSRKGRPFSATLVLKDTGRHGFEFPPRQAKKKATRKKPVLRRKPRRRKHPRRKPVVRKPRQEKDHRQEKNRDTQKEGGAEEQRRVGRSFFPVLLNGKRALNSSL